MLCEFTRAVPLTERIKNRGWLPVIETEGVFLKQPPKPPRKCHPWYKDLSVYERLGQHHTLASIRQGSIFLNLRSPKDSLDLKLMANYDHGNEAFPDPCDVVLQRDTMCNYNDLAPPCVLYSNNFTREPFRRLSNTKELKREMAIPIGHPLYVGGITERLSPFQPKMMCSSSHSPLTNPGYSRQPMYGTMFRY